MKRKEGQKMPKAKAYQITRWAPRVDEAQLKYWPPQLVPVIPIKRQQRQEKGDRS
jgi:hypothetical protein